MRKQLLKLWLLTCFLAIGTAYGQGTSQVTGVVTDGSNNETLPGVSVTVKGTTTGAVTDINGKYTLKAISADATLIFSFVGYDSQEVLPKRACSCQYHLSGK